MTRWVWPAVAGFIISVVAHLLAYVSPAWSPGLSVLWLMPNILVLWVVVIVRSWRLWPRGPVQSEADALARFDVLAGVPPIVWGLGAALVMYVMLNFFVSAGLLREGSPRIVNGRRYLDYKGRLVRNLTAEEYDRLSAAETRLATGHLMVFHGIAAVFFVWVDPRRRAT